MFTWDETKNALATTVSGETCHIGTYGTYVTMGVLRESKAQDSDYIARLYTFGESGTTPDTPDTPDVPDTPDTCTHQYREVVTMPNCTNEGYTTYTCLLCAHSYKGNTVAAKGHNYVDNVCSACGAVKSTGAQQQVTISFADLANRTEFSTSKQVWEQNGITVTNNKSSSQNDVANYKDPARFYMGSEVIIEYPGITKLEINCKGLEDRYVNGWLNAPSGASATNNDGVVTVIFSTPVNSVVYSNLSAQSRAYDITVYTEGGATSSCKHTNVTVEGATAPTCTVNGHTGKTRCLDCDDIVNEGQVILATNHVWADADCDTPKTCSVCKATEGAALGHNWTSATEEAPKTCTRCGATEGEELPGTTPGGDATPDDDKDNDSDKNTDEEESAAKDHSQCKASGIKAFLNAIYNFFSRLFGGKTKCVCGEFLDE